MRHVLTCSHPLASQHHDKEMTTLIKVLQTAYTPQQIIETIQFGFHRWWSDPNSAEARPPTAGSLQGPDAVLTSAFLEQFRDIGWYHMCMGRISTKWALAATKYNTLPNNPDAALHWVLILIAALWRFSKSLWQYQNGIVHGATVEEQALRKLQSVHDKITTLYNSYSENHNIALPRHQSFFHNRTLEEQLGASFDNMSAWLH
jgi:hypothetical protein